MAALEDRATAAEQRAASSAQSRTEIHEVTVTRACADSPAVRAALNGLRGAPPEPVVVRPTVPASLLVCHPEPPPPPQNADDVALGDYLVALADAGEDCRRNLSEVGKLVEH